MLSSIECDFMKNRSTVQDQTIPGKRGTDEHGDDWNIFDTGIWGQDMGSPYGGVAYIRIKYVFVSNWCFL